MSEGPTADWVVSLGSILGIFVSVTVAAGAAWRIIHYVKQRVTKEVVETREILTKNIVDLNVKLKENRDIFQTEIRDKVAAGDKRYDEMRYWVQRLQERSEHEDTELVRKLEVYRQERNEVIKSVQEQMERYRIERNENIREIREEVGKIVNEIIAIRKEVHDNSLKIVAMDKRVNGVHKE